MLQRRGCGGIHTVHLILHIAYLAYRNNGEFKAAEKWIRNLQNEPEALKDLANAVSAFYEDTYILILLFKIHCFSSTLVILISEKEVTSFYFFLDFTIILRKLKTKCRRNGIRLRTQHSDNWTLKKKTFYPQETSKNCQKNFS